MTVAEKVVPPTVTGLSLSEREAAQPGLLVQTALKIHPADTDESAFG